MPKDTKVRIHPRYRRFDHATNAAMVRGYLNDPLRHKLGCGGITDLRVTRVFPAPQDGFIVQYEVRFNGGDSLVLCGHLHGNQEERLPYIDDNSDRVVWIGQLGLAVPVFPFDPKLNVLEKLCRPEGELWLAGKLGWSVPDDVRTVRWEVMGYRLGKRCVIRYRHETDRDGGQTSSVVVKALRPQKLDSVMRINSALTASRLGPEAFAGIGITRTLFFDKTRSLHVTEFAPGVSLHDLTGKADFPRGCAGAARALGALHALKLPGLKLYRVADEINLLQSWVTRVGEIFPEHTRRFECVRRKVCETAVIDEIRPADATCIHRDFYDKQVLFDPARTTLLDCDTVSLGDPALDYGNFLAHVTLRELQCPGHADRLERGLVSFAEAYPAANTGIHSRATWWRAATLLRLAALYALRPRWRHLTEEILTQAELCTKEFISHR